MPIGLHFNITEGLPVCRSTEISTIVGDDGHFLGKSRFWEVACTESDLAFSKLHVARELVAQIELFKELTGKYPEFVDGHNHAHVASTAVADAFVETVRLFPSVKRTRLPIQPVSTNNPFYSIVHDCSVLAKIKFEGVFDELPSFIGMHVMGNELTAGAVQNAISQLIANENHMSESSVKGMTVELMVHPGYATQHKGGCTPGGDCFDEFSRSAEREFEMQALVDVIHSLKNDPKFNVELV